MKKLTKILAASLLLAVVLSCFGLFSTFAADAATASEPGIVTMYDMDSKSSIAFSNVATKDNPIEYPKVEKIQDGGKDVWNIHYEGMSAGETENTQDFLGSGGGWSVRIRDDEGDSATTRPAANRAGGTKNTDYIIIDLDVATNTEFIENIYWNTCVLKNGASNYKGNDSDGSSNRTLGSIKYYPAIKRGDDGKILVGNADGSNLRAAPVESDGKWTHVTIIYDFHSYLTPSTVTDPDTGETTTEMVESMANTAYVYINGYYAGTINSFANSASSIVFYLRMQTINDSTLSMDNESTMLSNYTVKRIEAGYNGMISDSGVLGSGIPLSEIPELAYCMEDAPDEPEGYAGKIADIKRGDETIEVYDFDDLNGDLLDGDIVTVYKDIARMGKTLVIKKISTTTTVTDETTGETTEVTEDVEANVVWQDVNGVELGAEGSLYAAPAVLWAASDASWAYVRNGVITSGGQSSYEGSGETAVIVDPLWSAINTSKGTMDVVLFEDYIMYGRSYGTEGSTSSSTKNLAGHVVLTFDLNGHSLTNNAKRSGAHLFTITGANTRVTFKNGTLVNNAGGINLVMAQNYDASSITVENCDVTIHGTIFDQRGVILYYINCNIDAKNYLTNVKSTGDDGASVNVIGCTITGSAASLINVAQTNHTKVGRYGSGTIGVQYYNTTVNCAAALYDGDIYADEGHSTTYEYAKNKVNHYFTVDGCDIITTNHLFLSEVANVPATGETVITARVNTVLKNSTIAAKDLGYSWTRTKNTEYVDYLHNVKIENCKIDSATLSAGKSDAPATVVIELGAGTAFTKMPANTDANNVTVNLPAGHALANTTLIEGYDLVVTSSFDTYTYQLGDQAPVEFYWNKPAEGTDEVDINRVVTIAPDVAGAYKYSWVEEGNAFKTLLTPDLDVNAKLSLTLFSDISMNLYVPKEIYDSAAFAVAVVDAYGVALTPEAAEIDGVDYYKFATGAIAPAAAENSVANLQLTVNGAYGESFTNTTEYSVAGYLASYTPTANESENALIDALINYILAAYEYMMMDTAGIDALRPAVESTVDLTDAKLESFAGVSVAVKFGKELAWVVKAAPATVLDVTYSVLGQPVTEQIVIPDSGIVAISVAPADFLGGITISDGTASAAVNLAGYCGALADEAAQKMVVALYNYAKCASDYRDSSLSQ